LTKQIFNKMTQCSLYFCTLARAPISIVRCVSDLNKQYMTQKC